MAIYSLFPSLFITSKYPYRFLTFSVLIIHILSNILMYRKVGKSRSSLDKNSQILLHSKQHPIYVIFIIRYHILIQYKKLICLT